MQVSHFIYVCMYAYMYVCMHVCMYVCVCVYSKETWQREWETTDKGRTTKEYFPNVAERLQEKINLTQNFTILVTDHGNLKSYLHRFKIIEAPDSPCGNGNQKTEHVLFDCRIL